MPSSTSTAQPPAPTAWQLLERYARGEVLSDDDLQAMQVGLFQFWRRERFRGVGNSVRDRDDVVSELVLSVLERKWPGRRLLDGRIATVTPELLATHLQFWLRRRRRSTGEQDKLNVPLPEDDLEQTEPHDDQDSMADASEIDWSSTQSAPAVSATPGGFEARCYTAARECVGGLKWQELRAIDLVLGTVYLDNAEANQKLASEQLGISAVDITRLLQKLGINQKRSWAAAAEQQAWLSSALGRYLIEGCQIQRGDPHGLEIAIRTLAWCNRARLGALKSMQAQPASHP